MKIPKNVIILGVTLVLIGTLTMGLLIKGRHRVKNVNPLAGIEDEKFSEIQIINDRSTMTFVQTESRWTLTEPVSDWVAPSDMERLVSTLRSFSVGSIISENPDRYSKFEVDEKSATYVKVKLKGKKKSTLQAYIGRYAKTGGQYFRFVDKTPVYIAQGLSMYLFNRRAEDYRLRDLIPLKSDQISRVTVEVGVTKFAMVKESTSVWKNEISGVEISVSSASKVTRQISNLRAIDFVETEKSLEENGLDQPFMTLIVESAAGTYKALIGKEIPTESDATVVNRTAQTEGRNAVLLINNPSIINLNTLIHSLL